MVDAARDGLGVYGTGEEAADAADSARHTDVTTITFDHLYATYLDRIYAYLRPALPTVRMQRT